MACYAQSRVPAMADQSAKNQAHALPPTAVIIHPALGFYRYFVAECSAVSLQSHRPKTITAQRVACAAHKTKHRRVATDFYPPLDTHWPNCLNASAANRNYESDGLLDYVFAHASDFACFSMPLVVARG